MRARISGGFNPIFLLPGIFSLLCNTFAYMIDFLYFPQFGSLLEVAYEIVVILLGFMQMLFLGLYYYMYAHGYDDPVTGY